MKRLILSTLVLGFGFYGSQAAAQSARMDSCKLLINQLGGGNIWVETKISLSAPEEVLDFEVSNGSVSVGSAVVDISVYYHQNGKVSVQQILQVKDELSMAVGQRSLQFHLKPFEQNGKMYSHVVINCL